MYNTWPHSAYYAKRSDAKIMQLNTIGQNHKYNLSTHTNKWADTIMPHCIQGNRCSHTIYIIFCSEDHLLKPDATKPKII